MPSEKSEYDFLDPPAKSGEIGRLGPYRVTGMLGKGGMGQVFRAEDGRLKRSVALKVMNQKFAATPNSKKRFVEEARAMAAVHHDNVATIFEVGLRAGMPFIAMEMLKGKTLEQWHGEGRPFTTEEILQLAKDVASGLSAAHQGGIVHRDIKPANLWIEESGRAKILDFGLAIAGADRFSRRASVMGTPGFLSPEQARNEPLDDRTDLYSLGVVLYQMCSGRLPLVSDSIPGQMISIIAHQPQPLHELNKDIPKPLSDLVAQLLEKEARDRPQSAALLEQQVVQTTKRCRDDSESALQIVTASATTAAKRPVKKRRHAESVAASDSHAADSNPFRWIALAGAAAVVLGVLVVAFIYSQGEPGPSQTVGDPATEPKPLVVRAGDLAALKLTPVSASENRVKSGDAARFQMRIENVATGDLNDPRKLTQGANVAAKVVTYLKRAGANVKRKAPTFPRSFSSRQLPSRGESQPLTMQMMTTTLAPGDFELIFELQTPTGTTIGSNSAKLTVTENLSEGDLLGFELLRTHAGGADAVVQSNAAKKVNESEKVLRVHRLRAGNAITEHHAYLRFDLSKAPVPRQEIDKAVLLLTVASGGHQAVSQIQVYGVPDAQATPWSAGESSQLSWQDSPSADGVASLVYLSKTRIDNGKDSMKGRADAIRIYGGNLDDFLRNSKSDVVTLVLVRENVAPKPTCFFAKEGNPEQAPALALRKR